MRQMPTEKLFDDGKYMVIYLSPESVKLDERMFFLWTKEDQHTMTRAQEKDTSSCEDMVAYPDKLLVSFILYKLRVISGNFLGLEVSDSCQRVSVQD